MALISVSSFIGSVVFLMLSILVFVEIENLRAQALPVWPTEDVYVVTKSRMDETDLSRQSTPKNE